MFRMMWYRLLRLARPNRTLKIMRGISGSGKSTLAQELGVGGVVFGTDDFWGEDYNFDRSKLGEAHQWNQDRAIKAMEQGISPIVIDNTNTQLWEMRPYVEAAVKHGYKVEFHEPNTPWKFNAEELAKRNSHGVPLDIIEQMLRNWEHNPTLESVLRAERPQPPATPEEEKDAHWRDTPAISGR